MLCRDDLGDHAAHRGADDVSLPNAECVQEAHGIFGHVVERVGQRCGLACLRGGHDRRKVRHAGGLEAGREADVAIVVADDPVAPFHEFLAQLDSATR